MSIKQAASEDVRSVEWMATATFAIYKEGSQSPGDRLIVVVEEASVRYAREGVVDIAAEITFVAIPSG